MRECFTQAAWNMWPYLYDQVLLPTHMWWLNGGSEAYFGYLYLWLDWHLLTAYFSQVLFNQTARRQCRDV